jgi:hypothetical protein
MDTYIEITWMAKKEKLLFYKRLTTRIFDQCTSRPAEHENLLMKWGEIVVNHRQHMHQTVHKINKKFNSRFTVKEGHEAKDLDATHNWSTTKTNEFVSKYAEGMIAFQWNKRILYTSIRITNIILWVMLTSGGDDKPVFKGENNVNPRFQ